MRSPRVRRWCREVYGVLELGYRRGPRLGKDSLARLQLFAGLVASALRRGLIHVSQQQRQRLSEQAQRVNGDLANPVVVGAAKR